MSPTICFLGSDELPDAKKLRAFNEGVDFVLTKPMKPELFKKLLAHVNKQRSKA